MALILLVSYYLCRQEWHYKFKHMENNSLKRQISKCFIFRKIIRLCGDWGFNKIRKLGALKTLLASSVQFSSVAQPCLTLYDPMNHSTPGLPVHQQHPEITQTHVHWVGDAIQPSHPLLSPSPLAPNPSQHQSLF